jgi:Fe2+ transport system protein B
MLVLFLFLVWFIPCIITLALMKKYKDATAWLMTFIPIANIGVFLAFVSEMHSEGKIKIKDPVKQWLEK